MRKSTLPPLISPRQLAAETVRPTGSRHVVILDASYHLPTSQRDGYREFLHSHIAGAAFFDVDKICDRDTTLPHMIPTPAFFAEAVHSLGIGRDTHVVCYETGGLFSAARAWWMFRLYGHENVSILDGGRAAWIREGGAVKTGNSPRYSPDGKRSHGLDFFPRFRPELVRTLEQIRKNIDQGSEILIDARSPARFAGKEAEPRAGLASGHIPGAYNLPFADFLDPETGYLKPVETLETIIRKAGINPQNDQCIASCGSGITACIIAFVLYLLGNGSVSVYDGSWAEWGGRSDTRIVSQAPAKPG